MVVQLLNTGGSGTGAVAASRAIRERLLYDTVNSRPHSGGLPIGATNRSGMRGAYHPEAGTTIARPECIWIAALPQTFSIFHLLRQSNINCMYVCIYIFYGS
jgi:hypothetical protein